MKVVLVTGGFDPLHSGHIEYFREAKALGDMLIVGLNNDAWLQRKKGRPFMPVWERVINDLPTDATYEEINCETDFVARTEDFKDFTRDVALHIAASNPSYVSSEEIPEDELNKEKDIIKEEVAASGKPAEHAEKIVEGKLGKWYEEVCLLNQPFVKDPNQTIEQLRQALVGKLGENIVISRFKRLEVGSAE